MLEGSNADHVTQPDRAAEDLASSVPAAADYPAAAPPAVPPLRASDAEREEVVTLLTDACAEGRLTLEELGARVGSAYTAVTRADLVPLTVDLPAPSQARGVAPAAASDVKGERKIRKWIVTVMGEVGRVGHWRLSDRTVGVTIMGETNLDLRGALIDSPEIELRLYMLMGAQHVIVPPGVEVEVTGGVLMGERQVDVAPLRPRPGVPRLHIRVFGLMGEVTIKTA